MSYEGKNFPSGTIGCDALNIPAALIKQITELCGSLNLFMGAMQLGMANAELFTSARESALQIVHKLKDIPPFSYLDEKRITAHIQKIFSNEYLENAMTYAKSLASGNLMNALDPQYQKALTLLRVVPVLAHLKPIIDRFLEYFISLNSGPQFGFFGDSWQTIYQSNKACGLIQHENIVEIKKGANFRSAPKIVDLLNFIRPELPQRSAIDNFAGEVTVITCDDYIGERRTDRNFKGDLPSPELKERLNGLMKHIKHSCIPASENVKTLMITHRVLAAQQGYNKLLDILKDGLRDKEDPFLLFFMEQLEPIYQALETNDMQLLFDTLKLKRYPITKKAEKVKWKNLQEALKIARQKNSVDVLQTVFEAKLIPIPAKIDGYYDLYLNAPETMYSGADVTIKDFLDIEYEQFLAAINYFHPEADFSTEHGVKGEEYDNVIFVISKGWNQYQFETYTPMIKNGYPQDKEAAYIRNRNLFYVCCSRPKKRLYFFVSVPVDRVFRKFLAEMVGEDNILTYSEFLNSQNHSKTE